jgi:hypothetical protein
MSVNPVSLRTAAIQNHNLQVKLENHHMELLMEQRHIKQRLDDNEEKRIEANRRMNRPGQNVDRIA